MPLQIPNQRHQELIASAKSLGATDSCLIPSAEIVIKDELALICKDPGCPNYGQSYSCPPYVQGPAHIRGLIKQLPHALVVRIIVPASSLLSWERVDIGRILHEMVANLEDGALRSGSTCAHAFAGDSCKDLFCSNHLNCQRVYENGPCRHPDLARPSMSGFGVDVYQMIQSCGWKTNLNEADYEGVEDELSWVAGLVLLD